MSNNRTKAMAGDPGRRRFLGGMGAVAATTLAPGVTLLAQGGDGWAEGKGRGDKGATDARRWGMLVDTHRCVQGCNACVSACGRENGLQSHGRPETDVTWIRKVVVRDRQTRRVSSLPMMCQHCERPPCVDVCPTGASFRRADGIVLVDRHICIGCRYCMMACPYKARSFAHEVARNQRPHAPRGKGTVEACTLCVHRIDEGAGRAPACVEACVTMGHGAMVFGDLNDPDSRIARRLTRYSSTALRGDLRLNPGVRYQGI